MEILRSEPAVDLPVEPPADAAITAPDSRPDTRTSLTSSALSVFRECPRKYFFAYELGRVRRSESPALSLGKVVHGALETWWKTGGSVEAAAEWLQQNATGLEEPDACRITAMIHHYRAPVHEYDVVAVEQPFRIEITNPESGRTSRRFLLDGKIDGLLRRKSDSSLWVLEHKTTSEEVQGFGPYWQRLAIDHQIAFYMIATGAQGVLYDVLRKPLIRPKQKETADEFGARCIETIGAEIEKYYQFREVRKTTDDITEAAQDLWQQAHLLGHARKQAFYPRNSNACRSLYGPCPFLDVCTGAARIDDDNLFRSKGARNEELQEAVS